MSILKELITVPDTLARLKAYKGRNLFLQLYQSLFPKEYEASDKSTNFGTGEHKTYSPKEQEFLELVHENYFPIYPNVYLDEREGFRDDFIQVASQGFQVCGCTDIDVVELCWKLVLVTTGDFESYDIGLISEEQTEVLNGILWIGSVEDYDLFYDICREAAGDPLNNPAAKETDQVLEVMPWLFKVAVDQAGNSFLDAPTCCQQDPWRIKWDKGTVEILGKEFSEAQKVNKLINEFDRWLKADIENLKKAVEVWNELGRKTGYVES